jgi:hypothetical protein
VGYGMRAIFSLCLLCLSLPIQAQTVTSFQPSAPVLPANTLRFYIAFDRPARGLVHQRDLELLDSKGMTVENAFMDFGQELWSPDGKRLTVLFDPGKIKRGVEAPHFELAPLKESEIYKVILGKAQHVFRVGPAIRERIEPALWVISTAGAPARSVDIKFDRVMDPALLEDQLRVEDEESRPVSGIMRVIDGGRGIRFEPPRPFKKGNYQINVSPILEDAAGNRITAALDHAVSEKPDDSSGAVIRFVAR